MYIICLFTYPPTDLPYNLIEYLHFISYWPPDENSRWPSGYLSAYIYLSIYASIYLSIYISIYSSIYKCIYIFSLVQRGKPVSSLRYILSLIQQPVFLHSRVHLLSDSYEEQGYFSLEYPSAMQNILFRLSLLLLNGTSCPLCWILLSGRVSLYLFSPLVQYFSLAE